MGNKKIPHAFPLDSMRLTTSTVHVFGSVLLICRAYRVLHVEGEEANYKDGLIYKISKKERWDVMVLCQQTRKINATCWATSIH